MTVNVPRFLLFAGDKFYPNGGWQDFQGAFTDVIDALEKASNLGKDWWHIVDLTNKKIVDEGIKA